MEKFAWKHFTVSIKNKTQHNWQKDRTNWFICNYMVIYDFVIDPSLIIQNIETNTQTQNIYQTINHI